MSLGTAREKVREKVRVALALSRCANLRNEAELLDYSLHATAAQVESHCQQLRNAQRSQSTVDANQTQHARYLRWVEHEGGTITLSVHLPKETGELVMKATEIAAAARLSKEARQTPPKVDADAFFRQQADALVQLAQVFLVTGTFVTAKARHFRGILRPV